MNGGGEENKSEEWIFKRRHEIFSAAVEGVSGERDTVLFICMSRRPTPYCAIEAYNKMTLYP